MLLKNILKCNKCSKGKTVTKDNSCFCLIDLNSYIKIKRYVPIWIYKQIY